MKLIVPILGSVALTCSYTLLAQEQSPSVAGEEKTAPTETASAAAAASPAATAEPTEKKAAKGTAKAEQPAVSPSAAPTTKKTSVEATLKDMENRWAAAIAKHDTAAIESFVAADYVGINPKGKIQSRRAMLDEIKGNKDTYTSAKNEKLDVHMYGSGVAVVVGTYREKGTGKDGKAFDRLYRFSDTWMDRAGKWQCIASELMLLSGK